MKFKLSNRFCLFFTALISIFAVTVAGIAAFAWFERQVSLTGNTTKETPAVQSGSTDLTVNNVKGYKYTYDESGEGITDYNTGHITKYGDSSGSSVNANENQGATTGFDVPSEGIGYYIVGDETWCESQGFDGSNKRKYKASIRLSNESFDKSNNFAMETNVYLAEDSNIKVRHHYINSGNTADDWVNAAVTNESSTYAEVLDGNVHVKDGQSGYYNIYLNKSSQLHFVLLRLGTNDSSQTNSAIRNPLKFSKNNLTKKNSAPVAGEMIYLKPTTIWDTANAGFGLYVFNNSSGEKKWVRMSGPCDDYYFTKIPTGTREGLIFLRLNSSFSDLEGTSRPDGNKVRNQTVDLTIEDSKTTFEITSMSNGDKGKSTGKWTTDGYHPRIYVRGGYSSQSWRLLSELTFSGTHNTYTGTVKIAKTKSFKVVDTTKKDLSEFETFTYYGDDYFESMNTTYFSGGDGDADIYVKAGCSFTISYYVNTHKFAISNIQDLSTTYYRIHVYKHVPNTDTYTEDSTLAYDEAGLESTHLNPQDPAAITGYTRCGKYYTNDDFAAESIYTELDEDLANGSTQSNRTPLYTYFDAIEVTITIKYAFLKKGGNEYDADATNTKARSDIVVNTYYGVTYEFPKAQAETGYTFVKYSTSQLGTSGDDKDEEETLTPTTNITYYAIYKPTEHDVSLNYKLFVNDAPFTSTSISPDSDVCYGTETYTPQSSVSDHSYRDPTSSVFYVFVFSGWYLDPSCTSEPYSSSTYISNPPSSDLVLYGRMNALPVTKMFVDTSTVNWTAPYVKVFKDSADESLQSYHSLTKKKFSSLNTIYEISFPTSYKLIIANNSNPSGNSRTTEIALSSTDKNGNSRGNNDWIFVQSSTGNYNFRDFTWEMFYQEPNDGEGYYIVGDLAPEGYSQYNWTFKYAIKLDTPTNDEATDLPRVQYLKTNIDISTIDEFQIWHFSSTNGRDALYQYAALDTTDSETVNVTTTEGRTNSNNIKIKPGVTGNLFSIYLFLNDQSQIKIRIFDKSKESIIYLNNSLENYNYTSFKMGHGDFDNVDTANKDRIAIYEQGLQITSNDINQTGGVQFAIRSKYYGIYHWAYYGDGKGSYNGLNTSYPYISAGTSNTFGDQTNSIADAIGFKITEPGFYNFYVLRDGTVSIVKIPGKYGEGFYICQPPSDDLTDTSDWDSGVKMKEITEDSAANVAVYTCYTVADDNLNIYIKSYISGIDNGVIKRKSSAFDTYATMNSTTGVVTFKHTGVYNIFVYKDYSNSGAYAISIAEYDTNEFYKLNPISRTCTTSQLVKDAHTSLVLEVNFTTTYDSEIDMSAFVELIKKTGVSGNLLSDYILYDYVVDPANLDTETSCYDYMRTYFYDTPFSSKHNYSETALDDSSNTHVLYLIIDYNPKLVAGIPYGTLVNDFFFVIKTRQLEATV